jgi:hypothetical protein
MSIPAIPPVNIPAVREFKLIMTEKDQSIGMEDTTCVQAIMELTSKKVLRQTG